MFIRDLNAACVQQLPAAFYRSSVHLVGGRPTLSLPMGPYGCVYPYKALINIKKKEKYLQKLILQIINLILQFCILGVATVDGILQLSHPQGHGVMALMQGGAQGLQTAVLGCHFLVGGADNFV